MIDVSVIIVSWNTRDLLLECLESLQRKHSRYQTEIIVVDNASQDGSCQAVVVRHPEVRVIRNRRNLGFAAAVNAGIGQSSGKYVCLLNSDARVIEDCLDKLCYFMEHHPKVGIVGPKILWPDMTVQDSCRNFPTLWNNFCLALGLSKLFPGSRIFQDEEIKAVGCNSILRVEALAGCLLLIRREVLSGVGFLDERFFLYSEEIDLCRRFWSSGWEVVFFPDAAAVHHLGASSATDQLRVKIERQTARLQYWKKHHRLPSRVAQKVIMVLHHSTRIVGGSLLCLISNSRRSKISPRVLESLRCLRALLEPSPAPRSK